MFRAMLIIILFCGLLLAGCTGINLAGELTAGDTETQGVDVAGLPTLTVNHFAGSITVLNGEDGHITANLTRKSRLTDAAEAEAQMSQITMAFTQQGTDVTLDIDTPEALRTSLSAPTADLELFVPTGTILMVNMGAGEITVDQPTGDVTINSGAGTAAAVLPADASFRLVVEGGAIGIESAFEGVPDGGVATEIDMTVGDAPTQTLIFNLGAGQVRLEKAE